MPKLFPIVNLMRLTEHEKYELLLGVFQVHPGLAMAKPQNMTTLTQRKIIRRVCDAMAQCLLDMNPIRSKE